MKPFKNEAFLCHNPPQQYGVDEAVRCFLENTHHKSSKGLFCFSMQAIRSAVISVKVRKGFWCRVSRVKNGSKSKGLNFFNKCFSSVVEAKTKSAAEVAFEKALPKSSFIGPAR